jgi:hypothetical protein
MQHSIGADEGLLPGFSAEKAVVDKQLPRLSDETFEELDSEPNDIIHSCVAEHDDLVTDGILADGGEPVA